MDLKLDEKAMEHYLNSDAGGKEFKVARLFGVQTQLLGILENHITEMRSMNKRIDAIEQRMNAWEAKR